MIMNELLTHATRTASTGLGRDRQVKQGSECNFFWTTNEVQYRALSDRHPDVGLRKLIPTYLGNRAENKGGRTAPLLCGYATPDGFPHADASPSTAGSSSSASPLARLLLNRTDNCLRSVSRPPLLPASLSS